VLRGPLPAFPRYTSMSYAIIALGGKQYRVREGERLLVDRLPHDENKTFHPRLLFLGGNGDGELAPSGVQVTARVVGHVLGDKIRIGKYRPKKGYRRHTGFRSRLSQIEIESIGKKAVTRKTDELVKPDGEEPKTTKGIPKGYEELTVAEINDASKRWRRPQLEAALAHEREHGKRKGALAALEGAIAAKEDEH
jgi:large subunit ribosomal protein L21